MTIQVLIGAMDHNHGFPWLGAAQVVAAVFAVLAAVAIPVVAFFRAPKLSILEDTEAAHSRVEGTGLPYIRLLVTNARFRRAGHHAQVLVERYSEHGAGAAPTTIGTPAHSGGPVNFYPAAAVRRTSS
jgi:hypothetical protein